ncbi:MAG: acyltransferase [Xanthomonadales bacterium]|nr:acyltransferase [Xanthomonadales bacterium]
MTDSAAAIAPVRTIAVAFEQGRDNFAWIRLIAAAAVIYGHSYALAATGLHDPIARMGWGPGVYSGSLAVDVFFVISGFLVTASYTRRRQWTAFVLSRLLRVVPGLAVCVTATALVLGGLLTTLPSGEYYGHSEVWQYLWGNLHFQADALRWTLPGVFADNPLPNVINGSLWTLPAEMQMYLAVAVLGLLGALRSGRLATAIILIAICAGVAQPQWPKAILHSDYLPLAGLFAIGALCWLNAHRIPLDGRWLVALIFGCYLLNGTPHASALMALTTAYATLWLAYGPTLSSKWLPGDYSYGLYLWGYPVQQCVVRLMDEPEPMRLFVYSLLATLPLAMVSWHLIEKPALSFKPRRRPRQATPQASAIPAPTAQGTE